MKLTVNVNQDAIQDFTGGGNSFINTEGVFDVLVKFASISETKGGAKQLDLNIEYNGSTQTIYGPTIINKNGEANQVGMGLVNKLGVISGLTDGGDLDIEKETHKVGKDQKPVEFDVITNFSDLACKLRVQREYSKWNGEIRRSLRIRNAFAEDGASAMEIIQDGERGKQLAIELEKYSSSPAYVDGVTAEEAEAWEESQRNNSKKGSGATTTSEIVNKQSKMFG